MSQNTITLDPDVDDGVSLATKIEAWRDAVHSSHRGTDRPAYAVAGTVWWKVVSSTIEQQYVYNGATDTLLGTLNPVTGIWTPAGQGDTVIAVTSSRTLDVNNALYVVDSSAGPVVLTLPEGATAGEPFNVRVKWEAGSTIVADVETHPVTYVPSGDNTVNGATGAQAIASMGETIALSLDIDTNPDNWVSASFSSVLTTSLAGKLDKATAVAALDFTGNQLTLTTNSGSNTRLALKHYGGTDGKDALITMYHSRGTPTVRSATQAADILGGIDIYGDNGAAATWGGGIRFLATSSGSGFATAMQVVNRNPGGVTQARYAFTDVAFAPTLDNSSSIGSAGLRWSVLYAASGTINTSDERLKQDIRALSAAEDRVAVALSKLIRAYKFRDSVAEKGDDARVHVGVIAQQVKDAFTAEGLDGTKYGVLCYDAWEEERDANGNIVREAGNRYGIRYDELSQWQARGADLRLTALEGAA